MKNRIVYLPFLLLTIVSCTPNEIESFNDIEVDPFAEALLETQIFTNEVVDLQNANNKMQVSMNIDHEDDPNFLTHYFDFEYPSKKFKIPGVQKRVWKKFFKTALASGSTGKNVCYMGLGNPLGIGNIYQYSKSQKRFRKVLNIKNTFSQQELNTFIATHKNTAPDWRIASKVKSSLNASISNKTSGDASLDNFIKINLGREKNSSMSLTNCRWLDIYEDDFKRIIHKKTDAKNTYRKALCQEKRFFVSGAVEVQNAMIQMGRFHGLKAELRTAIKMKKVIIGGFTVEVNKHDSISLHCKKKTFPLISLQYAVKKPNKFQSLIN